jgi:hypothetical protein
LRLALVMGPSSFKLECWNYRYTPPHLVLRINSNNVTDLFNQSFLTVTFNASFNHILHLLSVSRI